MLQGHKMHRKYFFVIALLAIASAFLATIYIWKEAHVPPPTSKMPIPQPLSPFKSYISGVGIVEASSKNIFIGSPVNRVVDKVEVVVGEKVKKNQVLFCLESRDLEADLHTRSIAYENSIAKLKKLEALPRKEDVASAEAILK